MIKYLIAHKICESNLEWNFDKSYNKKNYKKFVKMNFFNIFLNFDENLEIEHSIMML
jgi:hypothetical protein